MSMLQRILMIALVVSMACLVGVGQAWAQTSSLQGTVTDESGGVIPGADITVTNPETAEIRTAVSNDEGFYSVPLLKKGNYAVTCSISGFATAKTDILLDLNQIARHDFEMKVGEVSSVIEVESTTARISQEPHSVGTIIEEKQVSELPLNGRNYLQLAGLAPGILRGSQAGRGEQTSYNDGEEGGFKSGGLPMDQVAILVDGVDNASRIIQGSMITQAQTMKPAIEAIAEFKVITNNVSAEYGYKAGAQVQVSTKGGTNTFHGALYEFHRNRAVSATNFMFNRDAPTGESPPPYIRNQFGGVFGGPIIKDKTFFFFSFQGTRLVQGASSFTRSVPSALARAGDFSQENNTPGRHRRVFDPTTSGVGGERTEFAGGVIPSNRISPIAVNMLNMYPLPNSGDPNQRNNFFRVARRTNSGENYDIRIDHNLSDNHRMFGRYSYRNEDNVNRGALPFPANTSNFIRFRGHQVALNYNTTLGNRMHNEFRIGITRFPSSRANEHTEDLTTQFGFTGATAQLHADLLDPEFLVGSPTFFLDGTGYPGVGGAGVNTTKLNTFYVADNFLLDVGKHSLKFGGEYRSWSSDRLQGSAMGNMSFGRGGGVWGIYRAVSHRRCLG